MGSNGYLIPFYLGYPVCGTDILFLVAISIKHLIFTSCEKSRESIVFHCGTRGIYEFKSLEDTFFASVPVRFRL